MTAGNAMLKSNGHNIFSALAAPRKFFSKAMQGSLARNRRGLVELVPP
jgi:hypothetical protein